MRDFRFADDSPLLTQTSEVSIDGLSRSLISLRLELLPKLQTIGTSLLPSREHIFSIRVEGAAPFSPPLCFWEIFSFGPSLDGSPTNPNAAGNLLESETLFIECHDLLITNVTLGPSSETSSFIALLAALASSFLWQSLPHVRRRLVWKLL